MFVNPAGGGGGKGGAETSPVTDVNSLLAGAHLQVGHLIFLYWAFHISPHICVFTKEDAVQICGNIRSTLHIPDCRPL